MREKIKFLYFIPPEISGLQYIKYEFLDFQKNQDIMEEHI